MFKVLIDGETLMELSDHSEAVIATKVARSTLNFLDANSKHKVTIKEEVVPYEKLMQEAYKMARELKLPVLIYGENPFTTDANLAFCHNMINIDGRHIMSKAPISDNNAACIKAHFEDDCKTLVIGYDLGPKHKKSLPIQSGRER